MNLLRLNASTQHLNLPQTAVTIGNFDGVHLGHQAMIKQLKTVAQQKQLKTLVMLFEPQPLEVFYGEDAPPRISSLREKVTYLKELGVDYIVVARFDHFLREQTAAEFASLLKEKLNTQTLVLGDDFHFGKNRQGNTQFLRQAGFAVDNLNTVVLNGQRVSSTRVRETLQVGNLALAAQLLGRPYSMIGRVQHGDKLGRTLNFPTINVALKRHKPCLKGIYGVDVRCETQSLLDVVRKNDLTQGILGYQPNTLFGAANLGVRPAIEQKQPQWRLEVHFPDVSANLYGLLMRVTFLHYLHGERKYLSFEALKAGIQDDVLQLRQFRLQNTQFPFH
ncbi:bifunctional riboflavin kinase/FAD synthetase [Acinetobacter sp. B10A]|uniref:bifunctional riboflavin kinase/FAD synthetase n=1 Tax=Acinetobacter baretiae TaxID=2605383 RepID=UPI001B3C72A0|nr:bifunctional riboflavin kinase/FAD synthetase [Acinetobacter baretiae]MBF7685763.1 bifunctional riboflavin kinase/FAD synthetase [Acinetobacter baretiae]